MKKTTILTKVLTYEGLENEHMTTHYKDTPTIVYQNGVDGLFVGRSFKDKTDNGYAQNGRWIIYHHSGLTLPATFPSRKKAIEIMHRLSDLADWTQDTNTLGCDRALFDKTNRVCRGREA